eukprot:8843014-Ditylum_brightwellii.AAC.1
MCFKITQSLQQGLKHQGIQGTQHIKDIDLPSIHSDPKESQAYANLRAQRQSFFGIKYADNKNGSIFMHAEYMQDTKDNQYLEEHLLDPAVL